LVDALHGGRADAGDAGHGAGGDSFVVEPGDLSPKGFAALLAGENARQGRVEGFAALGASIPGMVDFQLAMLAQDVKVPKGSSMLPMQPRPRVVAIWTRRSSPACQDRRDLNALRFLLASDDLKPFNSYRL